MNRIIVCGEIGSTHENKLDKILRAVEIASEIGLDLIKFQLGTKHPNLTLPFEYFIKAYEHGKNLGMNVISSVFDDDLLQAYISLKPAYTKFAYSQKDHIYNQQLSINEGVPVIVSCDVLTRMQPVKEAIKLFCVPQYPVVYKMDFSKLFREMDFYGYSCHTLTTQEPKNAIRSGAMWIEKHFKIDDSLSTPDSLFSVSVNEMKEIVDAARYWENLKTKLETVRG